MNGARVTDRGHVIVRAESQDGLAMRHSSFDSIFD